MGTSDLPWTVEWQSECRTNAAGFWGGIAVWIDRPFILNKRLCAVQHLLTLPVTVGSKDSRPWWQVVSEHLRRVTATCPVSGDLDPDQAQDILHSALEELAADEGGDDVTVVLCELLPKRPGRYHRMYKLFVKDDANTTAVFIPWKLTNDVELQPVVDNQMYAVQFDPTDSKGPLLRLLIHDETSSTQYSEVAQSCVAWLREKILPKICQWCEQEAEAVDEPPRSLVSLNLVSAKDYSLLYQELRLKHGTHLVDMWTEKTDPQKFVYEDLAIASYLLVLWREERSRTGSTEKQSFVDLGCGNGLLTHILTAEGHTGIGIDVRKRKIWDHYGGDTKLIECSVVPSSSNLFPEYDWIIGNHSDELTPWIPVIAARSSRKMRFFLLPCCAHNFDSKFQRRNSKLSKYEDYLDFIHELCQLCGFLTERDKLRIPSTKRICLVGSQRSFPPELWPEVDSRISDYIASQRTQKVITNVATDTPADEHQQWASGFVARPRVEPVRNCTTLDAGLKESVVRTVFDALLRCSDATQPLADGRSWRTGGSLELCDLAQLVSSLKLQQMKNECGGLQTLLRNHYYIFQVVGGSVRLRNYAVESPYPKKKRVQLKQRPETKSRPCWFSKNHPDGCPAEGKCIFEHDQ